MANLNHKVISSEVERMCLEMGLTESDMCEFAEHFICRLAVAKGATTELGQWLIDHGMKLYHLREMLNGTYIQGSNAIDMKYLKGFK